MAFFDWDGNGKKDIADDFIEFQIYEECTKEDEDEMPVQHKSDTSGCSCLLSVLGILFIIKIIAELFI